MNSTNLNKVCKKCNEEKPFQDFANRKDSRDGKRNHCLPCFRVINTNNSSEAKMRRKNQKLKFTYGISLDQFNDMVKGQDNMCGICVGEFINETDKCIDHCHETNRIRGILCRKCNILLGHAKDNINILKNAIGYLNGEE